MKITRNTAARNCALMAGAAIAALSAGAAQAQSDTIIVTATKRPQTLQEVPVAVSVVDSQVIEDSQIVDLFDIQTVVPSLRVSQLQNSSQTTFVIRGFGNGANNPGIESSVGVFIDGVFRSRSASAILDLPTLERVEVLRGPQSTLFGKNVSAGAISITTKGPEYDWGGSVEATYGTFGQTIFRGSLTGPISDTLAFRLSGNLNNRDGTATNLVTDTDINDRDRYAVRGQLLWEPTDAVSFRLIGDYNKIDENCCAAVQIENGPATAIAIGAPPPFGLGEIIGDPTDPFAREVTIDTDTFNRLEGYGGSLQGDWDLGFAQLTSITSYREQTDDTNTDVDFSSAALAENPQNRSFETFTQEIRLTSSGDNRFDWLVGGFFFDETVTLERDVNFGTQIRPYVDNLLTLLGSPGALAGLEGALMLPSGTFFGPGQGVIGDYTMDNRSFSVFGQADFEITDRLTFTGGVAFNDDKKDVVGTSILTDVFSNVDLVQVGFGGAFSALTMLPPTPANIAAASGSPLPLAALAPGIVIDPATGQPLMGVSTVGAVANAIAQTPCDDANPALQCNAALGLSQVQFFDPQTSFPDPTNPLDNGQLDDNQVTYSLQLAYDVTDSINAYFTYATGWKAGAFNLSSDSRPPDPVTGVGRTAGPEDVRLFEFGVKANFDGGYINIALFDQRIEGFQSNAFNGVGFDLVNAGEQSVRGFEVESLYSPWDPLTFTFGATYLDPEYDSFLLAPCTPFDPVNCGNGEGARDLSGTRPAGIHPLSISTSMTYRHDFNDSLSGFARLEYLHETATPLIETIPLDITRDVKVVNASIGFEAEGGFDVLFWGRNLTNNDFFLQGFPTVVQEGSVSGYPNQPRTYGVTLRKSF